MAMEIAARKREIRKQAHANRRLQADKDQLSRQILTKFMALPEYQRAAAVMFYVDVGAEVRTRDGLEQALTSGKRIVVPYCVAGELKLFHLEQMAELEAGSYRVLEPKQQLRNIARKRERVEQLDLIMVPGVAFDHRGARIGHGEAYYDKLLQHATRRTALVALAFECQLFAEIPTEPHDVFMDKIVTENTWYAGRGRNSRPG